MTENRWETVWERVRAGRHTLVIGPSAVPSVPGDFADWASGHAALVLESVDALDGATLESLCQILQRPGWLRLPLRNRRGKR